MIIKILGSGCNNCVRLEANAKIAIKTLGKEAEFIKVTDFKEIAKYGVMRTPAIVVDEKVLAYGKVLTPDEIAQLLNKLG
jgi:small redox-active disulfide protein 2